MDLITLNNKIIKGDIQIEDVYKKVIEFIKKDLLNTIAYERIDQALNELVNRDFSNTLFKGIPILIKNLSQELTGEHNSSSSFLLKDFISSHTDSLVQRLIDLGFVIIGQTNTPEFGFRNTTESKMFKITRNAINPNYHAGGSSGGAAVCVKKGVVSLALASDGGGSIRIPASYNGLIGLKPSRGRIITGPKTHRNWQGASVHFPITKSMDDTILMLDLLSEYIPESPYSIYKDKESFLNKTNNLQNTKLKIAYSTTSPVNTDVSKEAIEAVNNIKNKLTNLGHTLVEDRPNYDGIKLINSYYLMNASEAYTLISGIKENPTLLDIEPLSYLLFNFGKNVVASDYIKAINYWDEVSIIMADFFNKYDLYLTPSTNGPAPIITHENNIDKNIDQIINSSTMNYHQQFELLTKVFNDSLSQTPFSQLANLTGIPAISFPTFENINKMPIGTQFMAPIGREDLLLYLGKQLEINNLLLL